MQAYDYVVVGSGAAGAVLASRLSERRDVTVLLVERGPAARSVLVDMPAGMPAVLKGGRYNLRLMSEPVAHLANRQIPLMQGRAVGGGTVVNGLAYMRGNAADYDGWAARGAAGWDYGGVLPYFRKSECHADRQDQYHGVHGPLHVRSADVEPASIAAAFLDAGAEAGYPLTEDFNGREQAGFGRFDRTTRAGRRVSAARAFIEPARARSNLTVMAETDMLGIRFDGNRAVGVRVRSGTAAIDIEARREVILSCGAHFTPQQLMLAGIGPEAELRRHGIAVRADRPGVGGNLQNHVDVPVQYRNLRRNSLLPAMRFPGKHLAGLQWLLFKSGSAASNHVEVGAFLPSAPEVERPDLQFIFVNIALKPGTLEPRPEHAFEIHVALMRPKSRGTVRLRSADPLAPPDVVANYLDHPEDRAAFRRGIRMARRIAEQPALRAFTGEEIMPGSDAQSDEAIDAWIAERARSLYHQCGTCRMGRPDDPDAVVDAQLRVIGVEGLRVADASVMPSVIAGGTYAPTMMIGEKAADLILGA